MGIIGPPSGGVGAWSETVSLGPKIEESILVPVAQKIAIRLEAGSSRAYLRGVIKTKEATTVADTLLTIPVGFRPAVAIYVAWVVNGATGVTLRVETSGILVCKTNLGIGNEVPLDGLDWNLT